MSTKVVIANKETANIIKNIYPLYLHDISEIYQILPNKYGIFEEDNVKTLMEEYSLQDTWFEKDGVLFPFIIFKDDIPAGFALVGSKEYVPKTCDYYMYDYFVLRPFRKSGIAEEAAKEVFSKFKGEWLVYTNPTERNPVGQNFWRKTISSYTNNKYDEHKGNTYDGEKIIFSFNNTK